jgi:hypothetical protein
MMKMQRLDLRLFLRESSIGPDREGRGEQGGGGSE